MTRITKLLRWIWKNLDSALAIVVALGSAVLGAFETITASMVMSLILAVLTILAIGHIRVRTLVSGLKEQVDHLALQARGSPLDSHVSFGTDERSIISEASSEIWMIQETGNLVSEVAKKELLEFLRRGGHVRAVLTTPNLTTAVLMAFRNAKKTRLWSRNCQTC